MLSILEQCCVSGTGLCASVFHTSGELHGGTVQPSTLSLWEHSRICPLELFSEAMRSPHSWILGCSCTRPAALPYPSFQNAWWNSDVRFERHMGALELETAWVPALTLPFTDPRSWASYSISLPRCLPLKDGAIKSPTRKPLKIK